MEALVKLIGEQAKILLENEPWVCEKLDTLKTEKERCEFLAVAAMYALTKVNKDIFKQYPL